MDSVLPEEVVIFLRHLRVVLMLGFISALPRYDFSCAVRYITVVDEMGVLDV